MCNNNSAAPYLVLCSAVLHLSLQMMRSQLPRQQGHAADLPQHVLIRILRRVDRQQRLSSAAFVSSTWAAAAAAATISVTMPADYIDGPAVESVNDWLAQHAGHVRRIKIPEHLHTSVPLVLPCSMLTRLQHLHVSCCNVVLSSSQAGTALALPALQSLKLDKVYKSRS
jgi:hypothetical protein